MTIRLFNRSWRVTIFRNKPTLDETRFFQPLPEGIEITELDIKFQIERTLKRTPNTCDLTVYNLSPATRGELQNPGLVVSLEAGYDGLMRTLFRGDVTFVRSVPKSTEWETEFQIGDGTRAFAHARADTLSYRSGTEAITVLRDVAKTMGLRMPKEVDIDPELREQFAGGFSFSGRSRDALTKLLEPFGYGWSIQDGQLQVLKESDTVNRVMPIDESAAMIGSPEFGKPTKQDKHPPMTVKCLLYPELAPGGRADLTSLGVSGIHKIVRVKHSGDSASDEWTTEAELKSV